MIPKYTFDQRKKLFTLAPIIIIPLMAFLFDLSGGGPGTETIDNEAGFDTSFPEAESNDIVDSRKLAYEEMDRLASQTNTSSSVIDEFDLDNMSVPAEDFNEEDWIETTPETRTEEDANYEVASLYENFLRRREDRSEMINQRSAETPPTSSLVPVKEVNQAITNEVPVVEERQVVDQNNLFFDNLNDRQNVPGNNNLSSNNDMVNSVSIAAVIHGEQKISRNGSFVKMRITEATELSGVNLPSNTIVYGLANLGSNNRLDISISSVSIGGSSVPVNLSTYDAADGREGILLSGGESGEVKNDAIDNAISDASMSGIPGGRLINRAARELFNKKDEATAIVLISNYKVHLKMNTR